MPTASATCKICSSESEYVFSATLLGRHDVSYFLCRECNFLQTEEPYWLEEAYGNSISFSDTGILARPLHLSQCVSIIIHLFFDREGKFLDFAGGYGLFVRRMRDIGFDFYWHDKYSPNLVAQGFGAPCGEEKFELVTTFEALEHFPDPLDELKQLTKLSDSIIFTTDLLPDPLPHPGTWYYYGLHHGQHISFYSLKTLRYLAQEFGMNLYSVGAIHLMTKKTISERRLRLALKLRGFGLFRHVMMQSKSLTVKDSLSFQNHT